jgi:hypothetical protein
VFFCSLLDVRDGSGAGCSPVSRSAIRQQGCTLRTTGYVMTANDSFDIGRDSYSPLSPAYFDRDPFAFDGTIERLVMKYLPQK